MKRAIDTILILTDFSDSAFHAAKFACMLSREFESRCMILLHVYQTFFPVMDIPLTSIGTADQLRRSSLAALQELQASLGEFTNEGVQRRLTVQDADLTEAVNSLCASEPIDLIVMGMTGKSNLEKILIGSNTSKLIENCNVPLLIVPKGATIAIPERIVLTTDLKDVKQKLSLDVLNSLLYTLQARLLVLNVKTAEENYEPEMRDEIETLHDVLDRYHPEYHYIDHPNITEGIDTFAIDHKASLIITIHKAETGIAGLLQKSLSKKLAWHSTTPVLVIPVTLLN